MSNLLRTFSTPMPPTTSLLMAIDGIELRTWNTRMGPSVLTSTCSQPFFGFSMLPCLKLFSMNGISSMGSIMNSSLQPVASMRMFRSESVLSF